MSAPSSQLSLDITHQNQFLFSNHYLNNRLPGRWKGESKDEVQLVMKQLQECWNQVNPEGLNKAQTEERWIKPVLDTLGHFCSVQVSIETPRNGRQPDYVMARDSAGQAKLRGVLTEENLSTALAVADAKKWGRNLDAKGTEDSRLSSVPTLQIDFYLRYSGVKWAILTNGQKWRLFHADTSHKLDVFYEVDLPQLLVQDSLDAFKYFYFFFRREAFEGSPSFLELVLEESRVYQHEVNDNLEDQVYDALVTLSQGFFDLNSNGLNPDEQTIQVVHNTSLIILYRLLFLLFSESRQLLPMDNRQYRDHYSLEHLKNVIRDQASMTLEIAGATNHWSYLQNLWRFVDQGQADLDIPPYIGGLFDPDEHPFLEKYKVGDRHLAKAIDLLARVKDPRTGTREFVDYRDLDVRHLGSIYEGLLEYKLRYADEPLTVDSTGEYVKTDESEDAEVPAGEVYLITDKGKRRASGSYYTPDYVIQYIIEHTVGPVLEGLREEHTRTDGELYDRQHLVERVLDVNVLDPAMGSGHFLVAVTDFIGRFLVEVSPEGDSAPTGDENELDYWRRRVAQACVYGVDINPLAVELAKLSLWIRTVARDKPLSFLDHHLRSGNSLIGATVEELPLKRQQSKHFQAKERRQPNLFGTNAFQEAMGAARGLMDQIEDIAGDTLADVRKAGELYEQLVEEQTKKPRRLANAMTAREFGLDVPSDVFDEFVDRLRNDTWRSAPQYVDLMEKIDDLAVEHHFFHWELEFPEVFFGHDGALATDDGGFDAVVGNPPYISANELNKNLSDYEKPFWKEQFDTSKGAYDLYILFIEQSTRLCRPQGLAGLITPNKFLSAPYGTSLRAWLFAHHRLVHFYDLSAAPVFPDASVYPVVTVLQNERDTDSYEFSVAKWQKESSDTHQTFSADVFEVLPDHISGFILENGASLVADLSQRTTTLAECANVVASTTAAEADSYSEALFEKGRMESPSALPIVNTGTIDPYRPLWGVEPLTHQGQRFLRPVLNVDSDRVPERRLQQYQAPKLIFAKVALAVEAVVDHNGDFASMNTNFGIGSDLTVQLLGAICNSRLMSWIYERYFGALRMSGRYLQFQAPQLKTLPIPRVVQRSIDDHEQRSSEVPDMSVISTEEKCIPENLTDTECCRWLGFLAREMTSFWTQMNRLDRAIDPFKYLNRDVNAVKFPKAFRDEIKFADQVFELGRVYHDLDDIALEPNGNCWEIKVQLKKRDPETGWEEWVKDGRNIVRKWVTAYRLPQISDKKAIYYKTAFEVFDGFEDTGNFPGGKTRTTKKKLDLTEIPEFDEELELSALVELTEERLEVQRKIAQTEALIDQLVYRLYGLTDEEIAIVEEGLSK